MLYSNVAKILSYFDYLYSGQTVNPKIGKGALKFKFKCHTPQGFLLFTEYPNAERKIKKISNEICKPTNLNSRKYINKSRGKERKEGESYSILPVPSWF